MIDDGLSVVRLAVMRLWGDGKSKGCLTLVELELDTCQDQHPCSSPYNDGNVHMKMLVMRQPMNSL